MSKKNNGIILKISSPEIAEFIRKYDLSPGFYVLGYGGGKDFFGFVRMGGDKTPVVNEKPRRFKTFNEALRFLSGILGAREIKGMRENFPYRFFVCEIKIDGRGSRQCYMHLDGVETAA